MAWCVGTAQCTSPVPDAVMRLSFSQDPASRPRSGSTRLGRDSHATLKGHLPDCSSISPVLSRHRLGSVLRAMSGNRCSANVALAPYTSKLDARRVGIDDRKVEAVTARGRLDGMGQQARLGFWRHKLNLQLVQRLHDSSVCGNRQNLLARFRVDALRLVPAPERTHHRTDQ